MWWKRIIAVVVGLALAWFAFSIAFWVVIGAPDPERTRSFVLASDSMSPALLAGERIVCAGGEQITPGSVIVFRVPPDGAMTRCSRVIAVGGQTVNVLGGGVHVDGRPLDEPYLDGRSSYPGSVVMPVELADGDVWVMGDNRSNSADSRWVGPISESSIVGVVTFRYWPLSKFGSVDSD